MTRRRLLRNLCVLGATVWSRKAAAGATTNSVKVRIPAAALFPVGQSSLVPDADRVLLQMIRALARGEPERLEVAVHSDCKGVPATNLKLTLDRAASIHTTLVRAFPLAEIRAVGRGDRSPVADNATIEGRNTNRRLELTVYRRASSSHA